MEDLTMRNSSLVKRCRNIVFMVLCLSLVPLNKAATAEDAAYKTAGGLAVYLGVVPAEIVKGHPSGHAERAMHGGTPPGRHQYHVVAALFDAATGARVSNASVTAQVSGVGLSRSTKKLELMEIAGTTTYGEFFNFPGSDLYTIRLTIQREGDSRAVVLDFKYDHRRSTHP
jgi:hypothetical protein